ncbi:MAG: HAD hydrolase-like protein [Candidatus Woesearchaeota archaeon]|nr:HAD hydrolase-like protein [Candidatus Woesearchaeota archaeon]
MADIFWDFDGTVISGRIVSNAYRHHCTMIGFELSIQEMRAIEKTERFYETIQTRVETALPFHTSQEAKKTSSRLFWHAYERELLSAGDTAFERGMQAVLGVLSEKHVLSIVTLADQQAVIRFLKKTKMLADITHVFGTSEYERSISKQELARKAVKQLGRKPALMIGDRSGDILAGRTVGACGVHVSWGNGVLNGISSEYTAKKPEDLLAIVSHELVFS